MDFRQRQKEAIMRYGQSDRRAQERNNKLLIELRGKNLELTLSTHPTNYLAFLRSGIERNHLYLSKDVNFTELLQNPTYVNDHKGFDLMIRDIKNIVSIDFEFYNTNTFDGNGKPFLSK